jgi:hypothetical protein
MEEFEYNGSTYERPILGDKVGETDTTQGDGTVGDLRAEVDKNMDPVYQDEFILGFQTMINEQWSWGVRGTYRKLTNAIDDMAITSTGVLCDGEPVDNGYVMANPGRVATIYSDTDCDGENDAYVNVDTSQGGWAMYDLDDNYIGDHGYETPSRGENVRLTVVGTRCDSGTSEIEFAGFAKSLGTYQRASNESYRMPARSLRSLYSSSSWTNAACVTGW